MRTSKIERGAAGASAAPRLEQTPMVIAPYIILDLTLRRGSRAVEAMRLFDAIAADNAAGVEDRVAWVAPTTIPMMHYFSRVGPHSDADARDVTASLLQLFRVAPLVNKDFDDALSYYFKEFEYDDAIQFVTCQRVGAKFLVTRNNFGHVKRAPVHRRTAGEMLPFFRK
jgi:hypothetical protein